MLINHPWPDPSDRYFLAVFDAIAGTVLFGAADAAAGAGAGALLGEAGAGFGAGLIGGGLEAAAPLALGEGALAGGLGAATLGSGLLDTVGGFGGGDLIEGGALQGATNAAGAIQPLTTAAATPITSVAPTASTVSGPLASAPLAPVSAGGVSPTATGVGLDAPVAGGTGSGAVTPASTGASTGAGGTNLTVSSGAPSSSGFSGGLDKAVKSVTGGLLDKSDLGTVLSAGQFGANLLKGDQMLPGQRSLGQAANNINAASGQLLTTGAGMVKQGQKLEDFINTGTLPPGMAQGLRTATEAAKAHIKSGYAQRGMSGSSAEAQDIQAAEDRATAAASDLSLQLLQQGAGIVATGVSTEGQAINSESLAASLYRDILNNALAEDQELGKSITNFASSLAGNNRSGNTITVKAA